MTMIVRSYGSGVQALVVARALEVAGIDGDKLRVIQGTLERDWHVAATGQFAGSTGGPVGTWANGDGRTMRGGSLVDGDGHDHDANREREGSFADVDYDTITSLPQGICRVSTIDHPRLIRLLTQAGLEQAAVEHAMVDLHHGTALLLVQVPDAQAGDVQTLLDRAEKRNTLSG
jgi:hypothetical protein